MIFDYHGIPIHYDLTGEGTALVLLHGFLESSQIWKNISEAISKKHQVVTIDLLGHGNSGYISPTISMEVQADMVSALLDHLAVENALFLGHSMGGYVSLAFLEKYPEKVNSIILLNSKTGADTATQKANRNRALKVLNNQKDTFIALAISNLFCEASKLKYHSTITTLKKLASRYPVKAIQSSVRGMRDRIDRTQLLLKFKKPKYILAGFEDAIVPFSQSEKEARETESTLIRLSGSHMGWIENEVEIVKILHLIDKK